MGEKKIEMYDELERNLETIRVGVSQMADLLKQVIDAWPDAGHQPVLREKILQALGEVNG